MVHLLWSVFLCILASAELTGRESQVAVFHHLGKEEALLDVDPASSVHDVHIGDAGESRPSAAGLFDGDEGFPDPLTVLENG